MRRGLALLLTATLALSMTACGGSKGAGTQKSEKGDGINLSLIHSLQLFPTRFDINLTMC